MTRLKRFLAGALPLLLALTSLPVLAQTEGASTPPGNAAAHSDLGGCLYQSSITTPASGQQMALHCDSSGNLLTSASGGGGGGAITAASGSYASGALSAGAIVDLGTGASPGANTTNGILKTINTTLGSPLQAGGTVAATQSGTWTSTVTQATASNLNAQIVGNVPAAGADSGNGVKISAVYNLTAPTYTNGQRIDIQANSRGELFTQLHLSTVTGADAFSNSSLGLPANTGNGVSLLPETAGGAFNGTSWDRERTIQGADQTGLGVLAVHTSPNANANSGIVPVVSSALESCHVLKASAGNLYTLAVSIQATTGFVQVFNATTAPSDGSVTPIWSQPVISNATLGGATWSFGDTPLRGSTGLTVCFSSATTPFTKTASATAMFSAGVE